MGVLPFSCVPCFLSFSCHILPLQNCPPFLRNGVFPAVSINKIVTTISNSGPPNVNFWAVRAPRKNHTYDLAAHPLPEAVLRSYGGRDTHKHTHTHTHTHKTGYSPLNSKEIKLVHPRGNQPWIFIGRTDAEAESPILWPPDTKSLLIGKETDAGKGWGQEKGVMVGWHHWLNGHVFEHTPGDRKGSLACCNPWGCSRSNWVTKQQLAPDS